MKMSDKTYNALKYFLMIFYPALTLLISTLGSIYNFDVEKILLTIGAIVTFLGTITGISNIKKKKKKGE